MSDRAPQRLFEHSENMECSFGETRQEHIQVVHGVRVFEHWRTLAREPNITHSMVRELNNTVDTIIGQMQQVHGFLHQYHDDINRIINADNKFEGVQGDMRRVLHGHEDRLKRVESSGGRWRSQAVGTPTIGMSHQHHNHPITVSHQQYHHPITITHQHHHHPISAGHLNGPQIPETTATPPLGSRAQLPLSFSAVAGCRRQGSPSAACPTPVQRTEGVQPPCRLA